MHSRTLLIGILATALACDLPRDANGTLDRIRRDGIVRVGYVQGSKWVALYGNTPTGIEPRLAGGIAQRAGARVQWVGGTQDDLLNDLHDRKLDLVVAGLEASSPWKSKVALTRAFVVDSSLPEKPIPHVMAAPPGENAWLVFIEQYLREQETRTSALVNHR